MVWQAVRRIRSDQGHAETVSEEELIEEINKFVETDDEFIEYKEGEK